MKSSISLFVIFFIFTSSFEAKKKVSVLEVLSATSRYSCAGIPGAGCTTLYSVKLSTKLASNKIKIDRFWVGKEYLPPSIKNITNIERTEFSKNDSILLVASKSTNVDKKFRPDYEEEKIKAYPVPYEYKGVALISYLYNKKRRYIEVESIKALPPVYHP